MKIGSTSSSGATAATSAAGGRRGAGGPESFSAAGSASGPQGAAPSAAASSAGRVGGLEALLALQEMGGPLERRRRALARGGRVLDGLDRVQLALLDGGDPRSALGDLARDAAEARERGDDIGLDDVLDEIDVRAAVELAKAETRRVA